MSTFGHALGSPGLSDPLPPEDSFVVAVQLRDYPVHRWWEHGRPAPTSALRAGQVTIYDLARDPRFLINHSFHSIHFQLPRVLLDAMADESDVKRLVDLRYRPGAGIDDPVIRTLATSIRAAFADPSSASRLFVDGVTMAVAAHVMARYGRTHAIRAPAGVSEESWHDAASKVDGTADRSRPATPRHERVTGRHCGLLRILGTTPLHPHVSSLRRRHTRPLAPAQGLVRMCRVLFRTRRTRRTCRT